MGFQRIDHNFIKLIVPLNFTDTQKKEKKFDQFRSIRLRPLQVSLYLDPEACGQGSLEQNV